MSFLSPVRRPLDDALTERLHLSGDTPLALSLVRAGIHICDSVSRLLLGQPFFALRESEALLGALAGLQGRDVVKALLDMAGGTDITAHGLAHVPPNGAVVIAATHPTGFFDFVAHAGALLGKRPDLKVVANQETERFLGPEIIVPVRIDKQNRAMSGRQTRRGMQRHLAGGGALLIFGSGRVPDRRNGRLVEPDWKNGVTRISEHARAPIIPAALDACNSAAYYRTRAIARFVSRGNDHFGAMIGSLRYSAEMQMRLGGHYHVHYGAPLAPGCAPRTIKTIAEGLVAGLYRDPPRQSSNNSG